MTLHYEKKNGFAYFTIDNGKHNITTPSMHKDLFGYLKDFEIDPNVRVGIIQGAGGRSFSAGDDIKTKYKPPRTRQEELEAYFFLHQNEGPSPSRPGWEQDVMKLTRYKPIIAAINGYCLGQGLIYSLLLTDIRVAGRGARLGLPEIRHGAAGMSAVIRLARHIPYTAAAMMALTGDWIDAEEARRIHLVNKVVADEDVLAEAEAIAANIARHPPTAVRTEMEALQIGFDMSRQDAAHHGQNLYRLHRYSYEGYGSSEGFFQPADSKK